MACLSVENPAEIQGIVIACKGTDFLDGIVSAFEKFPGGIDAYGGNVLHGRHTHVLFKTADKPADAHMTASGIVFNGDISVKTFIEIVDGVFHMLLVFIVFIGTFQLAAVDLCKQLAQVGAQQFFEAGTL